ncbi:MAG TPA: hypothetical protein VGO62_06115, partial [Myxococcota bacterium]
CAFNDDGSVIVAVGSDRFIRSLDGGATWVDPGTIFSGGNDWQPRDVAFGDGLFVAVGDAGIFTSPDGVAWSDAIAPQGLGHVAFGHHLWVAAGEGKVAVAGADIAQPWDSQHINAVHTVIYDGARFVLGGDFVTAFSSDGASWDQHTTNASAQLLAFATVGGAGVYASSTFPDIRESSSDAIAWSKNAGNGNDDNALAALIFVP